VVRRIGVALALAVLATTGGSAHPAAPWSQSDLDAFMKQVVAKRDDNWKKFQQYVLDERETFEIRGPGKIPLWGDRRDYTWYLRDGFFVRSPLKSNGVEISEPDRRKYEDEFLRREQNLEKRRTGKSGSVSIGGGVTVEHSRAGVPDDVAEAPVPMDAQSLIRQSREPQFISSAYFLRFKFEEGKYAFVGREQMDELELLKVEYYPARLFSHEQDSRTKRRAEGNKNRKDNEDAALEQMMNKVALVTLWIEPTAHQIVKYDFHNVNLDFLPGAWLLRLTDARATMLMHQPFPDVWLPKDVEMYFSAMLAIGEIDARYRINYHNYKLASTSARIK
jgi:hypothetical protein